MTPPASRPPGPTSQAPNIATAISAILLLGFIVAYLSIEPRTARYLSNERKCYANQASITRALEARPGPASEVREITPELLATLKREGLLDAVSDDPGEGSGSAGNYYLVQPGRGVACRVHGNIDRTVAGSKSKYYH